MADDKEVQVLITEKTYEVDKSDFFVRATHTHLQKRTQVHLRRHAHF